MVITLITPKNWLLSSLSSTKKRINSSKRDIINSWWSTTELTTRIGERELKVHADNNLQTSKTSRLRLKQSTSKWLKKKRSISWLWTSQVSSPCLLNLSHPSPMVIKICFTLLLAWKIKHPTILRFLRRMVSRVKYSTTTPMLGWEAKTWRLNWSLSFKLWTSRYLKNQKHSLEKFSKLLCI